MLDVHQGRIPGYVLAIDWPINGSRRQVEPPTSIPWPNVTVSGTSPLTLEVATDAEPSSVEWRVFRDAGPDRAPSIEDGRWACLPAGRGSCSYTIVPGQLVVTVPPAVRPGIAVLYMEWFVPNASRAYPEDVVRSVSLGWRMTR